MFSSLLSLKMSLSFEEYRRQVENYSSSRIRTLQYQYQIKQMNNELILKRLKSAKYLSENFDKYGEQLIHFIDSSLIHFITSEHFLQQCQIFLSDDQSNNFQLTDQQIQQLSPLDHIHILDFH